MTNTNIQLNSGSFGSLAIKNTKLLLGGLLLAGMLAVGATFSSVSADEDHVHIAAGSYTVSPPVLSGPPSTENGVTSIAGTVDVTTIGTQNGVALVTFGCTLGTGPRGVNECTGSFFFEGDVAGKTGTYQADMLDWIAGGEDAFTSAGFRMVPGSGTGGLSNLTTISGDLRRDEAAGSVGAFIGTYEFELIVVPPSDLGDFTVSELFVMEAKGTITLEELVAELTLRSESN